MALPIKMFDNTKPCNLLLPILVRPFDRLTAHGSRRSLFPIPYSLFPVPCSLFPVPCSLFPVPRSPFPVPCSLFPVPRSLFPVPCSLINNPERRKHCHRLFARGDRVKIPCDRLKQPEKFRFHPLDQL